MKSFKKLMSFNNHKAKERRDSLSQESLEPKPLVEEESKEMEDLRQMRKQYEGLYSKSSLVSSRATDFSFAIQELASYFVDTFGSTEEGEMSKVFKIVGRVEFEIAKILDLYALHVTQTITEPTEMLLTELRNVQDSKRQHDEKRQLYEQLRIRMVKGRSKSGKGEAFADQQLQVVKDEFDKLSMFVNTRLMSMEQGQARSLITQAARHHSAQMHLFSRGHSSLQSVEPYMRQVSRERNIDRQLSSVFNGLNEYDDDSDSKSDDVSYIEEVDDSSDSQSLQQSSRWDPHIDASEMSPSNQDEEAAVPKNLSKEWSSLLTKLGRNSGENPHLREGDPSLSSKKEEGRIPESSKGYKSRSVPLSPKDLFLEQETFQVTELVEESKSPKSFSRSSSPPLRSPPDIPTGPTRGLRISSSSELSSLSGRQSADRRSNSELGSFSERKSVERLSTSDGDADSVASAIQSDSSAGASSKFGHNSAPFLGPAQKLPGPMTLPPAMEKPPVLSFVSPTLSSTPVGFASNNDDARGHLRRYSQSGPLTFNGSPWSSQPSIGNMAPSTTQSGNSASADFPRSGPLGRSPLGRTFGSPRISPAMSPPRMSPPRISELHKLPPPPLNPVNTRPARSPSIITHSAPLSRYQEQLGNSVNATPLPPPPLGSVPRSLSLPTRQKQQRSKPPPIAQVPEVNEEESPTSSHSHSSTSTRATSSQQVQSVQKRASSASFDDQENGLPISDLKGVKSVPYNPGRSTSGTPDLSSQHMRQPSLTARGGKDKAQQLDGGRADLGSRPVTTLKTGGALNPPRWRSLSINDRDSYAQNLARAAVNHREFSHELVPT